MAILKEAHTAALAAAKKAKSTATAKVATKNTKPATKKEAIAAEKARAKAFADEALHKATIINTTTRRAPLTRGKKQKVQAAEEKEFEDDIEEPYISDAADNEYTQ